MLHSESSSSELLQSFQEFVSRRDFKKHWNPTESLKTLDEDEKSTLRISEGGPKRNIITEPGLYRLLFRQPCSTGRENNAA